MLHLSKRAFLSSLIFCLTVLTLSSAARAQQAPSATSSAMPRAGVATPSVDQRRALRAAAKERFLSQTTARLQSADTVNNVYHYVVTFPTKTKTTANLTITLQLNQSYRPTAKDLRRSGSGIELYGGSSSSNAASRSTTVRFFVPYRSLPPDVVKRLHASLPTAPASDATGAITPWMSYRYFSVAYQGDGQEGAPASGATELRGFWGSFLVELLQQETEPAVAQSLQNGVSEIPEAGETFTGGFFSGIDLIEAGMLGEEDDALLAQIMAYVDCVDNPSPQGLQNPTGPDQGDQYGSDAKEAVALQFALLMAKVAVPLATTEVSAGLGVLGGSFFAGAAAKASEYLAQDLQETLQNLQSLAPKCQPTLWEGVYKMSGTGASATGLTYTNQGTLQFSVAGGKIKGTMNGTYKNYAQMLNCSGETSFTGLLTGYTRMQAPYYDATVVGKAPPSTNWSITGTMFPGTPSARPCPNGGNNGVVPALHLIVCLVNNYEHKYDTFSANQACAGSSATSMAASDAIAAVDAGNQQLRKMGFHDTVSVTVRKLP